MTLRTASLAALLGALAPAALAAPPKYSIQGIGTLSGGFGSVAYGLNDAGQVVGGSFTRANNYSYVRTNPVIWSSGSLQQIGSRKGLAFDVNESGEVVGRTGSGGYNAFRYDAGSQSFESLDSALTGQGVGIASDGTVVGMVIPQKDRSLVGAWKPGSGAIETTPYLRDVNTLSVSSVGENGDFVGHDGEAAAGGVASPDSFLYTNGGFVDLTRPGGVRSGASAVNSALGQAVGLTNFADNTSRVTRWSYSGGMVTADYLSGVVPAGEQFTPTAMNDAGWIVGSVFGRIDTGPSLQDSGAQIFDGTAFYALDSLLDPASGWQVLGAMDINNLGQIAGYGLHDNRMEGFVLTPQAVPEPASLIALGLGSLALLRRRRLS